MSEIGLGAALGSVVSAIFGSTDDAASDWLVEGVSTFASAAGAASTGRGASAAGVGEVCALLGSLAAITFEVPSTAAADFNSPVPILRAGLVLRLSSVVSLSAVAAAAPSRFSQRGRCVLSTIRMRGFARSAARSIVRIVLSNVCSSNGLMKNMSQSISSACAMVVGSSLALHIIMAMPLSFSRI